MLPTYPSPTPVQQEQGDTATTILLPLPQLGPPSTPK